MDAVSVRRSESIAALAAAMCKAQAELKNPPKDSVNPHFKSKYADLATVRDCVIPVLARHGLAVMQFPSDLAGAPALTTVLAHSSGEFVESTARLNPVKPDPQGVGSALSYMRRYSLLSLAGVAAEDDDGHAASHRPAQQASRRPPPHDAEVDKADPVALFDELKRHLTAAPDEAALKAVFGRAFKASEAGRIGKDAFKALTALKDQRKAELANTTA